MTPPALEDFCDVCDALLEQAEKDACPRWGHDALCNCCADGYAEANPGMAPGDVAVHH